MKIGLQKYLTWKTKYYQIIFWKNETFDFFCFFRPKKTLNSKKYGVDLICYTHAVNTALHSSTKVDGLYLKCIMDKKKLNYNFLLGVFSVFALLTYKSFQKLSWKYRSVYIMYFMNKLKLRFEFHQIHKKNNFFSNVNEIPG